MSNCDQETLISLWPRRNSWTAAEWACFLRLLSRCIRSVAVTFPRCQQQGFEECLQEFIAVKMLRGKMWEYEEVTCQLFRNAFKRLMIDLVDADKNSPTGFLRGRPLLEECGGDDTDAENVNGQGFDGLTHGATASDHVMERLAIDPPSSSPLLPRLNASLPQQCKQFLDGLPPRHQALHIDLLRCYCQNSAFSQLLALYGPSYDYQGVLLGVVVRNPDPTRPMVDYPRTLLGRWLTKVLGPAAPGGVDPDLNAVKSAIRALCREVQDHPRPQF